MTTRKGNVTLSAQPSVKAIFANFFSAGRDITVGTGHLGVELTEKAAIGVMHASEEARGFGIDYRDTRLASKEGARNEREEKYGVVAAVVSAPASVVATAPAVPVIDAATMALMSTMIAQAVAAAVQAPVMQAAAAVDLTSEVVN